MKKLKAYSEVTWTAQIDRLIGEEPTQKLGERFGISPLAIVRRRRELGIVSARAARRAKPIRWTKARDKLLGTMPDTTLAKQLGTSPFYVRQRRQEKQVPAYVVPDAPPPNQIRRARHSWTEAEIAKLGTAPDTILAERWDLASGVVTSKRQELGIEPFIAMGPVEWTDDMLNLLGELPDSTLARECEVGFMAIKIKRIELRIPPFGQTEMDPDPELPLDVIGQIGKIPDKQLADAYGVLRTKIRIYRALHEIEPADYIRPTEHLWTPEDDALLGTMSDGDVARQLDVPPGQVMGRRRRLGIAAWQRKAVIRWTAGRVAQLGQEPDHILARRWKCSQVALRAKREELGIEAHSRSREWTDDEIALLGTLPDNEIGRRLNLSSTAVRNKRVALEIRPNRPSGRYKWKQRDLKRLGTVPDAELAIDLGLSYQFVATKRRELGIESYRRRKVEWTADVVERLGKRPDPEIARELKVSVSLIRMKRSELGIPPYSAK